MNNELATFMTIARALAPYLSGVDLINASESVMETLPSESTVPFTLNQYSQRVYSHDDLVSIALNTQAVVVEVANGKKINAIKELRSVSLCGLKEAKEAVEDSRVSRFGY